MNLERQKAFIIHFIFIAMLLLLVFVGIKYLLPMLMPFVIGIIIAVAFRRIIDLIEKKTRLKRVIVSIIILIVFYGLLGLLVSLIGVKAFTFVGTLFHNMPSVYKDTILPALGIVTDNISGNFPSIKVYLDDFMKNIDQSIFDFILKCIVYCSGNDNRFSRGGTDTFN